VLDNLKTRVVLNFWICFAMRKMALRHARFDTIIVRPPRYNWNIVESGVKHHQANKQTINVSQMKIIICLLSLSICLDMIKHSFF
jgi:hypothetical protein